MSSDKLDMYILQSATDKQSACWVNICCVNSLTTGLRTNCQHTWMQLFGKQVCFYLHSDAKCIQFFFLVAVAGSSAGEQWLVAKQALQTLKRMPKTGCIL